MTCTAPGRRARPALVALWAALSLAACDGATGGGDGEPAPGDCCRPDGPPMTPDGAPDAPDADPDAPDGARPADAAPPDAELPDAELPDAPPDAELPDAPPDAELPDALPDADPACEPPPPHVGEPLAALDACGRLTYGLYANRGQDNAVHRLPDFSHAGYMGGGVALPAVPTVITLDPPGGDARALIQGALDDLAARPPDADGFRGAVLLRRGEWPVDGTLQITASGVVLRGEGQGADGTVITATRRAQHSVIEIIGDHPALAEVDGTRRRITTPYVPVGSHRLAVEDAAGFAAGDPIAVLRTPNAAWVEALDTARYGWAPDGYHIAFERRITAIDGDTLTLDLPIVDTIEDGFGGGAVYRVDHSGRVQRAGVEDLRIVSEFAGAQDEQHAWKAVRLAKASHCWVRGVTAVHLGYAAVSIEDRSSFNTVEDCAFLEPVSQVTGSRRYAFNLGGGTGNLFQRCYAEEARHDFVSGARTTGPNVWLDCYSARSSNDDGPHHRWATGLLFDNTASLYLHVENRADSGTGHGWSGAQTLFWNGRARGVRCDAPPGAMNYAIGCVGEQQEGGWRPDEPPGWFESHGAPVEPRSLYLQQLADRLGPAAVERITLPEQRAGRIWDLLAGWAGEGRIEDAEPVEEQPACADGIVAGDVCCAAACGACGGSGCGSRPGGAADCCAGTIRSAGLSCADHPPPCVISD